MSLSNHHRFPFRRGAGLRQWNSTATVAACLAFCLICLALWLRSEGSRLGQRLVHASFDTSLVLAQSSAPPLTNSPVAIVYLDLQSYLEERQDPAQPWDRALHAQLVERLTCAGARAIVFDIIFSGPGPNPEADTAFAEQLRENGRVVLGAELTASSRVDEQAGGVRQLRLVLPNADLLEAAATWGVAHSRIDDDFVVRQHFTGFPQNSQPSLVWATAELLDLPVTRDRAFAEDQHWIRYYAPPFAVPHVSYSDALDLSSVDNAFFRDRVVFVGARPMTALFPDRRDETRSPFVTHNDRELFHPGVEVHAIQMLNLMRGDWLVRAPANLEALLFSLVGLLSAVTLIRLRPWPGAVVTVAAALLAPAGSVLAIQQGIWFPWLIISAAQLPVAFTGALIYHSVDWFRARRRLETIRRQAEHKIREQAALIDKAHDAILLTDLEGTLTYANPSAHRLYEGSFNELRQANNGGNSLTHSREMLRIAHQATLNHGEWSGELEQRTLKGEPIVVESRWTLIRESEGPPQAILVINTDVTEKKQIEAQFLRTQRQDTIGSLAGGMAHDLNNALAPILMGLQLLHRRFPEDDSRRMLNQMEASTHRCADLVRQVLLFSRGHEASREFLSVGPLAREMETLLREILPPNIEMRTLLPDDLWTVFGDSTQLHQVWLNLCVNARDAMPEGGTLTIAADNVELDEQEAATIPGARVGSFVMLLVSDTGTGIPPEIREQIFEPFYTTKPEGQGTGLGLSTVASVAKNHDGFLRMESEAGIGTTFEVYLPRIEQPAEPPETMLPESPRGQGELVLVIDDELSILDMLSTALQEQGYRTATASNGMEAIGLLRQRADELRLVILDRLMPGMEGMETLRQIRQLSPTLPIILVSGQPTDTSRPELGPKELVVVLGKPFRLEELFRLAHKLTHSATR